MDASLPDDQQAAAVRTTDRCTACPKEEQAFFSVSTHGVRIKVLAREYQMSAQQGYGCTYLAYTTAVAVCHDACGARWDRPACAWTGHSVYKTSHPEFSEKEVSTRREAYEALAEPILLCRKG